jgi:hypothetical protein
LGDRVGGRTAPSRPNQLQGIVEVVDQSYSKFVVAGDLLILLIDGDRVKHSRSHRSDDTEADWSEVASVVPTDTRATHSTRNREWNEIEV